MNLQSFLALAASQPYFDLPMALQWTGMERQSMLMQLTRWTRAGYLTPLRRGLHTVAGPFRKRPHSAPELANAIYSPSYLSLEWALSQYGLIPEAVPVFTSVTTRVTRTFANQLGRFEYRHIQQAFFTGFSRRELLGAEIYMAHPEKAILDFLYFSSGDWSAERHGEMRWQNLGSLRIGKLREAAAAYPDRVRRAVDGIRKSKAGEKGIRI
jgi:predicted transcriptional regulator of viral defense system